MDTTTASGHSDASLLFVDENCRAEILIEQGDLSGAARILVDVVQADAQNYRAYNNMGMIAWLQRSWEDAFTMFQTSVSLKPDYLDALVNLFDASIKLHRVDTVLPLFEKALTLMPDTQEIKAIVEAIKTQGDTIYTSIRATAIGVYNKRVEEAAKLLSDGKLNSAMELYLRINDEEGPHPDVFCGLGVISFHQKRYDDAVALFRESLTLNPFNTDTFHNMLDAARECGKMEEAKKVYQAIVKDVPALTAIVKNYGNLDDWL